MSERIQCQDTVQVAVGCECTNDVHQTPLEKGYMQGSTDAHHRLEAGWLNLACPDCGHYGWLERQLFTDLELAAHDARIREDALGPVRELVDEMDGDRALYAQIETRMLASEGRDADAVQDIVVGWLRRRLEGGLPAACLEAGCVSGDHADICPVAGPQGGACGKSPDPATAAVIDTDVEHHFTTKDER